MIVLVISVCFTSVSFADNRGRHPNNRYNDRGHYNHRHNKSDPWVNLGTALILGTVIGITQSQPQRYRPLQQVQYYPPQQYVGGVCDKYRHNPGAWRECQRGVKERREQERREYLNRAYNEGRGW